jgi:probable selenium-dependent hydroxylase accessory protein YqeC
MAGLTNLYEQIEQDLLGEHAFVSITGGGGKTTTMIGLARHLKARGKKVLITTTTKVASPYLLNYGQDIIFNDESILTHKPIPAQVVFFAKQSQDAHKWCSPELATLTQLYPCYDVIISEADGSRNLPLKLHSARDPQIHPLTTATLSLMGTWAIGKPTAQVVFGLVSDAEVSETVVDKVYLDWYISNEEGLLKGSIPEHRAIIFNGCDLGYDRKLLRTLKLPKDVKCYASVAKEGLLYETF